MDPLDSGVGASIESYAKSHGVAVIDYDRLTLGGSRCVLRQLQQRRGRHPDRPGLRGLRHRRARHQAERPGHEGRSDRQQRHPVRSGLPRGARPAVLQRQVRQRRRAGRNLDPGRRGERVPAGSSPRTRTSTRSLTPNDENAAPIIHYLQTRGVKANTFPVTGQDATLVGLQNILAGYQCGTVYKPIYLEAQAAVALAMYLRAGKTPPAALVNGRPPTTRRSTSRSRRSCSSRLGHHDQHELDRHRGPVRAGPAAVRRLLRRRLQDRGHLGMTVGLTSTRRRAR